MRAARIHGPSRITIDEVPIKEPARNEVLVKVKAVGLCGTDYELYTNELIYIQNGQTKLPLIPGHEWSGVVEEVGENVTKFKAGDKVVGECTVSCGSCTYCRRGRYNQCQERTETGIIGRDGGFAEYITFPEAYLHQFSSISFAEAALVEPVGIALHAVRRGQVTPVENVMVTGPGPIGLLTAQILKNVYNAHRVILTGTRDERLKTAEQYNLDGLINVKEGNLQEKVSEYTEGEMIDVVIETSGGRTVFQDIEKVINPCGRVVLVGFFGKKDIPIDWDSFITREIDLISSLGSPGIWDNVLKLMENKKIEVQSLISHVFKLEAIEEAIEVMVTRKDNALKVLITP